MNTPLSTLFFAALLSAAATTTHAGFQDAGDPPAGASTQPAADKVALEALSPGGPRVGKSRAERRREKCAYLAREQGLSGEALQRHMQTCKKR